jgi:uncharacterized protein (DUF1684 family)
VSLGGAVCAAPVNETSYEVEVQRWRAERDARLRAPDGWLSVTGLDWLEPGMNRFGSAPDNHIVLPSPVPAHAGAFVVEGRAVKLVVEPGAAFTLNGSAARSSPGALRTDATPAPDVFASGTVTWQLIERGERLGVRAKDSANPARRAFAGSRWFAIEPAYRVVARLIPRAGGTKMVVPDASGGRQTLESPGTLAFTLLGQALRLDPVLDGDDASDQMIVFRDLTSGRETYGGGRFVRARRQPDGTFVVDFNLAYAPPCAFTPHATCPLPPEQNRLKLAVRAGEKNGDGHGGAPQTQSQTRSDEKPPK